MYDDIAVLKKFGESSFDAAGNEIVNVEETEVYVQPRGVYSSEFYNAAQIGLKPSITLFIANMEDYDGQKILTFQGQDYDVIRVDWNAQRDGISLICEERVGDPIITPEESESLMEIEIQMKEILDSYSKEVRRAAANSQDVVAKEGVAKLKNTSPKGTPHKRRYAEGWAIKREKTGTGIPVVTIYNKTNPQLTHLLENSHVIRNGTGREYGETSGIKHIGPVNDWAIEELPKEIKRELE